jgi:hypothetical protein
MPEGTSTSFIPKNTTKVRKPRSGRRIYVFSYVSYVIFFGTLLTIIGAYVYSLQVNRSLENQRAQLDAERQSFSDSDIAYVRDLEKRLLVAARLVGESSAPSRLFDAIQSVIADNVALVDFKYERQPNNNFMLTFTGAMNQFDAAIFQRELFAAVPSLADAKVSQYVYGAATEGNKDVPAVAGKRLVVTFESMGNTSLFPYQPDQTPVSFAPSSDEATTTATTTEEVDTAASTTATTTTVTASSTTTGNE